MTAGAQVYILPTKIHKIKNAERKKIMKVIKNYGSFNQRRYGNPWVAIVDPKTARPDFSERVGGYTGGYGLGEAGELYVNDPQENAVYMFGQKDYRGNNTERQYVQYKNGEFIPVSPENLVEVLSGIPAEQDEPQSTDKNDSEFVPVSSENSVEVLSDTSAEQEPQSTDEIDGEYTDEERKILSGEKSENSDLHFVYKDMPDTIEAIDDDLRHFNAKYVYLNIELNYPELEGTEKQINYAQDILRRAAQDYIDDYFSYYNYRRKSMFGFSVRFDENQEQARERYKAEIEDLMARAREKGATAKDTANLSRFVVWMIENDTANSLWSWAKASGKAGEVIELSKRLSAKSRELRKKYQKEFLFDEA